VVHNISLERSAQREANNKTMRQVLQSAYITEVMEEKGTLHASSTGRSPALIEMTSILEFRDEYG